MTLLLVYIAGSIYLCGNFYTSAICEAETKDKLVSVTFDDGPDKDVTPKLLDILKENNVKAAFFVIGEKAEKNPDLIKRIHNEGHLIGNHSFKHGFWFDMKCKRGMAKELKRTDDVINKIISKEMKLFRPPYGVTNPVLARTVKMMDYKVIGWSVRSFDKSRNSVEKIVSNVAKKISPGGIILLHDDHNNILEILNGIIKEAGEKSFRFVPLDEMLKVNAYKND